MLTNQRLLEIMKYLQDVRLGYQVADNRRYVAVVDDLLKEREEFLRKVAELEELVTAPPVK